MLRHPERSRISGEAKDLPLNGHEPWNRIVCSFSDDRQPVAHSSPSLA